MLYKTFKHKGSFTLESGKTLPGFNLGYTTHGKLNGAKDNVVWIFHAFTGNSNPAEWWPGLIGENTFFDPATYFIICVNMPGSCYGSLGPLDINPETGEPYYHDFPLFTTRDMVRAFRYLKDHLGIEKVFIGMGGSIGGQQLMEWAVEEPALFEYIIPISTNAVHSSWGVAFNVSQRLCIENDATWKNRAADAGINGMKVARSIGLLSYRHYDKYVLSQQGFTPETEMLGVDRQVTKAETYQRYQGEKLAKRFNAFSYYFLSLAMDKHNIGRNRSSIHAALATVTAKTLVIAISSDILFPPVEQELLAAHIPNAELAIINSQYGHDGLLLEYEQITELIEGFLAKDKGSRALG